MLAFFAAVALPTPREPPCRGREINFSVAAGWTRRYTPRSAVLAVSSTASIAVAADATQRARRGFEVKQDQGRRGMIWLWPGEWESRASAEGSGRPGELPGGENARHQGAREDGAAEALRRDKVLQTCTQGRGRRAGPWWRRGYRSLALSAAECRQNQNWHFFGLNLQSVGAPTGTYMYVCTSSYVPHVCKFIT